MNTLTTRLSTTTPTPTCMTSTINMPTALTIPRLRIRYRTATGYEHPRLVHTHAHYPDIHHRHDHES
jgi:hypothetical protein